MSVEEPEPPALRGTLEGFREAFNPDGLTELESATVPEKPYRLAKLILEVADDPADNVTDVWLDEMLKSGGGVTVTMTVVV